VVESWDRFWNYSALFRRGFIVQTVIWGFGLLLEVPIRVFLIFKVNLTDQAFLLSNIIIYSWIGVLILFSIIYGRRMVKQGKKMMAEVIAAAAASANIDDETNETSV